MADKGFEIKVLVPTDDGITISSRGIKGSNYFLMYNVSNRSYQLAGKIKTKDFLRSKLDIQVKMNELIINENVDMIVGQDENLNLNCSFIKVSETEIEEFVKILIDKIEKNELE